MWVKVLSPFNCFHNDISSSVSSVTTASLRQVSHPSPCLQPWVECGYIGSWGRNWMDAESSTRGVGGRRVLKSKKHTFERIRTCNTSIPCQEPSLAQWPRESTRRNSAGPFQRRASGWESKRTMNFIRLLRRPAWHSQDRGGKRIIRGGEYLVWNLVHVSLAAV